MYRLTSRLSQVDADQFADAIATDATMGTAHPAVPKVRRLAEPGQDEESDLFELEELKSIAIVLETHEFVQRYPEGYAKLGAEVTKILTTGQA